MKVIAVDNFDKGTVSDILICENCQDHMGLLIAKLLNDAFPPEASYFYKCVDDDYELYIPEY
jgi:hypothetical protein